MSIYVQAWTECTAIYSETLLLLNRFGAEVFEQCQVLLTWGAFVLLNRFDTLLELAAVPTQYL